MKRNLIVQCLCISVLTGLFLGVYRGRIALWKDQDPQPVRVFPYYAATLPEEMQQDLKNGIPIDSISDLEALLEKYLP